MLTDCIGHNSLVRPLKKLESQGVKVTKIKPSAEDGVLAPLDIEKNITSDTKLLAVTHASNVTGLVQPIEEYGDIAKKHGLVFMVDAAQTAGMYPIDIQESNIDLLALPGHKGLLGPPGTGVLYVGDRVDLDTLREGGTGVYSEQEEQPHTFPYGYESGTLNTVGIAGWERALNLYLKKGWRRFCPIKNCCWTGWPGGCCRFRG